MATTLPVTKADVKMSIDHHVGSIAHNLAHGTDHFSPGVTDRLKGLQKVNPKVATQQAKKAVAQLDKVGKKFKPFLKSAKVAAQ